MIGNIFDNISKTSLCELTLKEFIGKYPQFVSPTNLNTKIIKYSQYKRYFVSESGLSYYISTENIDDPILNNEIIEFFTQRGICVSIGVLIGV